MSVLVESDWIIDGLGNRPEALSAIGALRSRGLAVSTVALGEVLEGAYGSTDPHGEVARCHLFLAGFAVLPVSEQVAETFARLRADLRRQGNLIADLDLLIAATAVTHGLELLTRNARHFARVPGLHPPS